MKKIVIFLIIALMSIAVVSAAEVCFVAQFEEDKVKGDCVDVDEDANGYIVLESSDIKFTWSDEGDYGHALCKIEDFGDDVAGTACSWGSEYWGFFLFIDDGWAYMPVGFDSPGECWNGDPTSFGGHYCAKDGDLIGLSYGEYGTMPNMLLIKDITIKVDGDKSSADEAGEKIKDAEPESTIDITVELENLYPDEVDIDIENIEAEVLIEDIDDGDDIEEGSDEIKLKSEENEEIEISFNLPLAVEEDNYDLILSVTAEDEKGIEYYLEIPFILEVSKEKHELKFTKTELYPETLECRSDSVLEISLVNIGTKEEDVVLTITSNELGINIRDEFSLDDEPFDSNSRFNKNYYLDIGNVKQGSYTIKIKADYEDKEEVKMVSLNVAECKASGQGLGENINVEVTRAENPLGTSQEQEKQDNNYSFTESYGSLIFVVSSLFVVLAVFLFTLFAIIRK